VTQREAAESQRQRIGERGAEMGERRASEPALGRGTGGQGRGVIWY
jgi:hypothetical protein